MGDRRDDEVTADVNVPSTNPGLSHGAIAWRCVRFATGFAACWCLCWFLAAMLAEHPRELAKRALCGSNMGGSGKSIADYKERYDGHMPPDLVTLVREGQTFAMFRCPCVRLAPYEYNHPPESLDGLCTYVYTGPVSGQAGGHLPLIFELPANHQQRAANILPCDSPTLSMDSAGHPDTGADWRPPAVLRLAPLDLIRPVNEMNRYLDGRRRAAE